MEVRKEDVERILELKRGNINISGLLVKEEIDKKLESDLNLRVQNKIINLSKLKSNLLDDESCGYKFKVKFVMYAVGHLLSPTMRSALKRR